MSLSSLLSIVSLALSTFSVITSVVLLSRQTTFIRQSNHLPVSVDLAREFRSDDFLEAQNYVVNTLKTEHSPDAGVSELPLEARKAIDKVTSYFTGLGAMVAQGILDEPFATNFMGYRANLIWIALEPYILRERSLRNDSDYLIFYEDLICRIRENWPPSAGRFDLRSLQR
ncbi:hypothetical protein AB0L06_01575 [Spirillospora sp. NPDC052269]